MRLNWIGRGVSAASTAPLEALFKSAVAGRFALCADAAQLPGERVHHIDAHPGGRWAAACHIRNVDMLAEESAMTWWRGT